MKTFLVSCVFLYISSMMNCSFCHCNGYDDDRIMEIPPQDSIIERLTSTCIKRSDLRRDPDQDSTYYDNYFMTFVFLKSNDTTKVIVMGRYNTPFVLHDRCRGKKNFAGFFKRNKTYCFFYNNLYQSASDNKPIDALNSILKGWRLRSPSENPDFFPLELGEIDPFVYEYVIDSLGNYVFIKSGYW